MPPSVIPAAKHPSSVERQRNFSGAAVLLSADRERNLVGVPRHDPKLPMDNSNMASGAESLLQKQERDSETDEESENDGLIVHDEELRPFRGKTRSSPRLEALYLSHAYKWFNHVAFGGNLLLLLWVLWGVLTSEVVPPELVYLQRTETYGIDVAELSEAIQYEDRLIDHRQHVPPPNTVVKNWATWYNGFKGETFRVTREELQNSGVWYEDALELEDGDYQGGLGMMHELHCLAWLHQSYASQNTSVFEREEHVIGHLDHCLEILLRSAKCRPDLTIGGLYWADEVGDVKLHRQARTQKCVKWEGIEDWLEPRLLHRKNGVLEGLKSPEGIVRHNPASND